MMKEQKNILTVPYDTPCGQLLLGAHDGRLCLCDWMSRKNRQAVDSRLQRLLHAVPTGHTAHDRVLDTARQQLDEYFGRKRTTFSVPLLLAGTECQKPVWALLAASPYGTVLSYAQLARRLGNPRAVRAVASANGANALSIFIPCHRVIGSDGSMTGYAGGMAAKEYLLQLERDPQPSI